MHISIIGYGKLASCIVKGLKNHHEIKLKISSPSFANQIPDELKGIDCTYNNCDVINNADIVIIAVKPHNIQLVLQEIAPNLSIYTCLISLAAGKELNCLAQNLIDHMPIIRAMPNTSASINQSPTALIANNYVNLRQKKITTELFEKLGQAIWLKDESLMDVITALVGSGPAFVYEFIHKLSLAAQKLGLDKSSANNLSCQMALGASKMALKQSDKLNDLKAQVTSKGGTTEAGLKSLDEQQFGLAVEAAINSATNKAKELH